MPLSLRESRMILREQLSTIAGDSGYPSLRMSDFERSCVTYDSDWDYNPTPEEHEQMKKQRRYFTVAIEALHGMQAYVCKLQVQKYKEEIARTSRLTPPRVQLQKGRYVLVDGYHRVQALHELGDKMVKVTFHTW